MGLNSAQPYAAGFHVNTEDLNTRENVDATAVTVSFPSTDPSFFPQGGWLAGGMFVQAQDTRYRYIDYGFYMMVVLDSSGKLFVDLGLHQTREETTPIQMPSEVLVYARTWQILGSERTAPVTLQQSWDNGTVCYSVTIREARYNLTSIHIPSLPDCQHIIPRFYAGNVVVRPFPFSRYVNYFQFGVVSSQPIADSHWQVYLRNPCMQRKTGWILVDNAWSLQGDASYLDWSWRWGGTPYYGVDAQHYQNPLEKPYELVFQYTGKSLVPGRILWKAPGPQTGDAASDVASKPSEILQPWLTAFLVLVTVATLCRKRRTKREPEFRLSS
jgi:hypothetical protein